jgi:hypothetical protein
LTSTEGVPPLGFTGSASKAHQQGEHADRKPLTGAWYDRTSRLPTHQRPHSKLGQLPLRTLPHFDFADIYPRCRFTARPRSSTLAASQLGGLIPAGVPLIEAEKLSEKAEPPQPASSGTWGGISKVGSSLGEANSAAASIWLRRYEIDYRNDD